MSTIEEVAKEAGVSVATVSRVLNKSNKVTLKTKIKVEETIKRLKYEPNMLGRNLRRSESRMILALLPSISNPFYTMIIKGIEDIARDNGYNVLLCQTDSEPERELVYINLLKQRLADGLISLDPKIDINVLKGISQDYPIVQSCEYSEELNLPYVTIDNFQAGYQAVKHLISIGKKKIAFINSDNKFIYARLREKGYIKALEEAGLEINKDYIINGENDFESGQKNMQQLLALKNRPDAVFLVSDVLAIGALKAIRDMSLSVPEDIAVVGFDNIDFSTMMNPALTTIAQPMYEIGCESCRLLLNRIHHRNADIEKIIMDFELIIRESTIK
ncbi:transcriptional regulator, LacI family [Natronincola peptidivorans]|uniref:Transcriptional regulator, LacI family n=1 Tax=Natronincola peptidivorans TaxID=426128 RepID=A0A1I0CE71_9FIRM|nr:LacI family DNA-binding transcriptional regulator [Natronincola peptidivorans]SET17342.1 transcriptional regulator, LacI family [Natronincola peptidivorans]